MQTFEIECDYIGMKYYVQGVFSCVWVDDSFSHEFGVHRCGHYEVVDVDVYRIEQINGDDCFQVDWNLLDADVKEFVTDKIKQEAVCLC